MGGFNSLTSLTRSPWLTEWFCWAAVANLHVRRPLELVQGVDDLKAWIETVNKHKNSITCLIIPLCD